MEIDKHEQKLTNVGISFFISELKEGNLRAILGLFFSLSRYKQQQKSCQLSSLVQPTSHQPTACIAPANRVSSSCGLDSQPTMLSKLAYLLPVSNRIIQMMSMIFRLPSPFKASNSNRNSVGVVSPPTTSVSSNGNNRRSLNNAHKIVSNGTTSGKFSEYEVIKESRVWLYFCSVEGRGVTPDSKKLQEKNNEGATVGVRTSDQVSKFWQYSNLTNY